MINNNLPVEEVNAEVVPFTAIGSQGELIKDDNDVLTEKLFVMFLLNLSEDYREKYKDKVVFIKDIPIEKQKEFIECFKTNNKDTINTTLEIIMNDYSKDKIEIINPPITTITEEEILNFKYHLNNNVNRYYDNIKSYRKSHFHTTKHQPDKKSKKSARRNNRRAKRNNR